MEMLAEFLFLRWDVNTTKKRERERERRVVTHTNGALLPCLVTLI